MTPRKIKQVNLKNNYHAQKHFLQTKAWGSFQKSLGNDIISKQGTSDDGGTWEYLSIVEKGRFSSRLYCPYGPVHTSFDALREALVSLEEEARHHRVSFVRVEPRGTITVEELALLKLKKAAHNTQPPDTIIYDVRMNMVSEEDIIMRATSTRRQRYRYNIREGVEFKVSYNPADIRHFLTMIHAVANRTGMQPHDDTYFETIAEVLFPQKAAGLLLSILDGKPIATMIFYSDGITLGYAHAGSSNSQRKLSPSTGLLMFAQLFARETGHTYLDTYGAAPLGAGKDHPWAGFTDFKESFGGERVSYSGTWELPVSRLRHAIYRSAGKLLEPSR